jgi:putative membrane-bound dehydrogenase-like protein
MKLWLPWFALALFINGPGIPCLRSADFPAPYNSEANTNAAPPSPPQALAMLKMPTGFKATVFAAEPEVRNPIAMAWDARGRLWIAENFTYAESKRKFDFSLRDRILFFEDTDGDGRFDSRGVFTDELQCLTSVEVGLGGVWALCPPQLLFIPDRNGDGVPDGTAQVVLDGFTIPPANYHNFANGLRWGPDGWLYGRCGASAPGEVGVPGTPAGERVPLQGGVWRYHPRREAFEALVCGTTNPWGHDWDERGELFFINTVNGHLWHVIPGAHFVRPHTIDSNPRAYELIDMHADHWHFDTGKDWTQSRNGAANAYGGGHAHVGAMIYLGDNWPATYRGNLFTLNMHGWRANQEILERAGSGYVARHGEDAFIFGDAWFRGIELGYGPDGGVFVLDWSDTGECHESTGVHRASGRIYKITYGQPKAIDVGDLASMSVSDLVKLHSHRNEWFVRQARVELAERALGSDVKAAKTELRQLFERSGEVVIKLRALWSLFVIGAADENLLREQLRHPDEHIRAWAIRLLSDAWPLDTLMSQRPATTVDMFDFPSPPSGERAQSENQNLPSPVLFKDLLRLAKADSSALVRLALASVLQRLPVSQRAQLAAPLLTHSEDANDHNLPLLIWYGLIPVGDSALMTLSELAADSRIPLTQKLIARRLAEDVEKNPEPLNALLKVAATRDELFQANILAGVAEGLRGWSKARKPPAWDALQKKIASTQNATLRERARDLSVIFGDGRALEEVKAIALDDKADVRFRRTALQTLIDKRPPYLREICEQLLNVRFLNAVAVRGLALFDDPALGEKIAASYQKFHPSERSALIDTLASRPVFAVALLDEMSEGHIPRSDLTPFHVRQIRSFNQPKLAEQLAKVWGELRGTAADKQQLIADYKRKLTPKALALADRSAGRIVFSNACASCHTLYGRGGQVGPDLTGSNRDNLDYLLEHIVDPSSMVSADFRMSVLDLKDGRTLTGLIAAQTERTIALKTQTETLTIERETVERVQQSTLSLMPEGLLQALNSEQVRNLISYLMSRTQVP